RASLALAISAGQPDLQPAPSAPPAVITGAARFAESSARAQQIVTSILANPPSGQQMLVKRRTFPVPSASISAGLPDFSAGRAADRTLGPFRDSLGRPVWIDIFLFTEQFRLVRSPGAAPFATVPIRGLIASGDHFNLPAGSVWIASQQLTPTAPAGGYTGLEIKGGTLTFSQSLTSSANEIVIPPAVTCTLVLQLEEGTAAAGSGPGQDGRLSQCATPTTATFVFMASGGVISGVGKGHLQAYGTGAGINVQTTPAPAYDAAVGRILVPAKADITQFQAVEVHSNVF